MKNQAKKSIYSQISNLILIASLITPVVLFKMGGDVEGDIVAAQKAYQDSIQSEQTQLALAN